MIGRLVVLLVAANLAWAAWSQGWLRPLGFGPAEQAEPERVQQQVRPQAMVLRPLPGGAASAPVRAEAPARARPAAAPASSAPEPAPVAKSEGTCLQAGVFDDKQAEALRRAAAALPAGSWRIDEVPLPGRWMVYVGKLPDADAVRARRSELRELGVDTDRPGAALEPGLSLGRFSNEEAAQRALTELGRKGVRGARVVQERRDVAGHLLRLPQADAALRAQAENLGVALAGKSLRACE